MRKPKFYRVKCSCYVDIIAYDEDEAFEKVSDDDIAYAIEPEEIELIEEIEKEWEAR